MSDVWNLIMPPFNFRRTFFEKDEENIPKSTDSDIFDRLEPFDEVTHGPQLLGELEKNGETNMSPPPVSRSCFFSPVQCLLMTSRMQNVLKGGKQQIAALRSTFVRDGLLSSLEAADAKHRKYSLKKAIRSVLHRAR
ncbi:unnamed protein product [Toxocara canis]|uniref:Uncharacterized protein n=1 Tax=Toxocara canis TaxID=6265 RepID=A0A183UH25_TOXCA|nr:unnamed protein product [Toxocara canis]